MTPATPPATPPAKVGLVLGAGGPVGHAYHAGLLWALHERLGWDPRSAHLVVGTSAGAQVGALLRAGMPARDLAARITGEPMTGEGAAIAPHYERPSHRGSVDDPPRRLGPSSPRYLWNALRRPWRARPGRLLAALLPAGRVCLRRQADGLRRLFGLGWPERRLWITAVDLWSGDAVAFGRHDAPQTDVGTAVTCSGAVPAICAPVHVNGRVYVDGGVASPTHLDMLHEERIDVVLVSSPLSSMPLLKLLLQREVRRLTRRGIEVLLFEPSGPARAAMGYNPMDLSRAPKVAQAAYLETLQMLESPSRARTLLAQVA